MAVSACEMVIASASGTPCSSTGPRRSPEWGETVLASSAPALALTDTQRRVLVALCRPYRDGGFETPATNQEIADELFLSVDAVKMHLRTLFGKFELGELPQNQKRVEARRERAAVGRGLTPRARLAIAAPERAGLDIPARAGRRRSASERAPHGRGR